MVFTLMADLEVGGIRDVAATAVDGLANDMG